MRRYRIPVIDPDFDDDDWLAGAVRAIGRTGALQLEQLFADVDYHEGTAALSTAKLSLAVAYDHPEPRQKWSLPPSKPKPPPVQWVEAEPEEDPVAAAQVAMKRWIKVAFG